MDYSFFRDLLSFDSTSGKEREVALWLYDTLQAPRKEQFEVGDGTLNLLLSWGTPKVVFCSHMDTVPPYIPPTFEEGVVKGRGSCDAKGQIFAMYSACKKLEAEGCTDFGLLLVSGEETGSWGAKAFSKTGFKAPFLIVGEPTENKMVSASKGTLSYDLCFTGKAFHSGYPQYGVSAVDLFNAFYNQLKAQDWGLDPELGETTFNIGLLHSESVFIIEITVLKALKLHIPGLPEELAVDTLIDHSPCNGNYLTVQNGVIKAHRTEHNGDHDDEDHDPRKFLTGFKCVDDKAHEESTVEQPFKVSEKSAYSLVHNELRAYAHHKSAGKDIVLYCPAPSDLSFFLFITHWIFLKENVFRLLYNLKETLSFKF